MGYGEQSALADIILPEATSLERWDHHSTNNYGLVPYTGVRQPLVEPAGETKSVQIILRDLARRIGGGMETYFDFEDEESYYKEWYKNLPIPWEDFKKRGIWWDTEREKDYELYERPLTDTELADTTVEETTGRVMKAGKAVGIMRDGKAVRGFNTPSKVIDIYDEERCLSTRILKRTISSSPHSNGTYTLRAVQVIGSTMRRSCTRIPFSCILILARRSVYRKVMK
ncbi:MAG: molybdopterin-dependent oxidoreductase [Verrucomicrobiales bacterium]|nr:molybdopterin-dependent oxidoreductase [Verrucomicrobiales bacterium]